MTLFKDMAAFVAAYWMVLLPMALAVAALTWLLPRPRGRSIGRGAACGLAALLAGGALLFRSGRSVTPETVLFYAFAGMAILGGVFLIVQRNPARAAISFAVVVMNVGGIFLLQAAPFLMAATLIIYAGAIIVTFLFVLMLAQQTGFSNADDRSREPFLAAFAGFMLLGVLLIGLLRSYPESQTLARTIERLESTRDQASLQEIRSRLGDSTEIVRLLRHEAMRRGGSSRVIDFENAVIDLEAVLGSGQAGVEQIRLRIDEVCQAGHALIRQDEPKPLPAANTKALGLSLFSEHLFAVEMGGTLLLVATIGAIAIAGRRAEATT
jgi:NADH:ubiquinone oxidoreductase subunit 6 (subunit J)